MKMKACRYKEHHQTVCTGLPVRDRYNYMENRIIWHSYTVCQGGYWQL